MSRDTQSPEVVFSDFDLSPEIHKAVESVGYETPTPIQAQTIPPMLDGRDVLGVAQTGTGKTAAFALPVLSKIDLNARTPQILCLAPTRELAIQVAEAFHTYAKHLKGFRVLPIYGGTDYRNQIRQLERGVQVVVGTPGRVMDHIRRGTLVLSDLKTLVLDEADEMLRMGFIDDVEWILEQTPEQHQTALFSATMPPRIKQITKKYLNDPAEVMIRTQSTTSPAIRQRYLQVRPFEKIDMLARILEVEDFDATLVFVRTRNATVEVAERLQARGYAVEPLNGDIAQNQREKTLGRLKSGKIDILIATDVAARGLHVDRISHVVNFDVPYDTESYVHRIGRTGRAGKEGDAILFVTWREKRMLQAVERITKQKIEPFTFPSAQVLNDRKIEQLFTRIDAELQKDLAEYSSVIKKYMERSEDADLSLLAAAMASLGADSKPFYIKEMAAPPRETRDRDRDRGPDRPMRGDRPDRRPEKRALKQTESRPAYAAVGSETYRMEVGEKHGLGKGDVVGAIANEAGIEAKHIGKIEIFQEHSYVDLPEGMPREILKTLKKIWVRGKQLDISKQSTKKPANTKPRAERLPGKRKAPK